MSDYICKRRRKSYRDSKLRNGCKMESIVRTYAEPKMRITSHYPITKKVTPSNDGGTLHITQRPSVNGKKNGCITCNGKVYNVVIVPNPNPDTNIDDDIIVKKNKCKSEV